MKAEDRPHRSLEDVEERAMVVGFADSGKSQMRPVVRDEARPRPEGHRIPLAVRQGDRYDERHGENERARARSRTFAMRFAWLHGAVDVRACLQQCASCISAAFAHSKKQRSEP